MIRLQLKVKTGLAKVTPAAWCSGARTDSSSWPGDTLGHPGSPCLCLPDGSQGHKSACERDQPGGRSPMKGWGAGRVSMQPTRPQPAFQLRTWAFLQKVCGAINTDSLPGTFKVPGAEWSVLIFVIRFHPHNSSVTWMLLASLKKKDPMRLRGDRTCPRSLSQDCPRTVKAWTQKPLVTHSSPSYPLSCDQLWSDPLPELPRPHERVTTSLICNCHINRSTSCT